MNLSFGCKYTHRYPGYPASTAEAFLPSNIEVWLFNHVCEAGHCEEMPVEEISVEEISGKTCWM